MFTTLLSIQCLLNTITQTINCNWFITNYQTISASSWYVVITIGTYHDDVIKWRHFPYYCGFVRRLHRSPVNSPRKGQWRGALMFSLTWALNKRSSKQLWDWWFETPSRSLCHHCNDSINARYVIYATWIATISFTYCIPVKLPWIYPRAPEIIRLPEISRITWQLWYWRVMKVTAHVPSLLLSRRMHLMIFISQPTQLLVMHITVKWFDTQWCPVFLEWYDITS